MSDKGVRAFIGISLPSATNRYLGPLITSLKAPAKGAGGRWVAPANRHITLLFLGQIQAPQIPQLARLIAVVGQTAAPFDVRVEHIRQFPDAKSPVIAAMLAPSPPLSNLFEQLQTGGAALGFKRERRRFRPHITLARLRGSQHWLRDPVPLDLPIAVDTIKLLQSAPDPAGSQYSPLATAALTAFTTQ